MAFLCLTAEALRRREFLKKISASLRLCGGDIETVLGYPTVTTYRSKSLRLSEASVGWRDEKATTDPRASIDGPALDSIHSPSASPLTRVVAPVVRSKTNTSHSRLKSSATIRSLASD